MTGELLKYDEACRAVAEAYAVDEVKEILDKTVAIEVYARQVKNQELETAAAKIRMRAERRLGQLMAELHAEGRIHRGGRPAAETSSNSEPVSQVKLADLGIDKKLSSRAQDLAALPDEAFGGLLDDVDRRGGLGEKIARDMLRRRHHEAQRAEFCQRTADGCSVEDLEALAATGRRYGVFYVDPPWEYLTWSARGQDRAEANHYRVGPLDEIKALGSVVGRLAARDSVLLMWVTGPFDRLAYEVSDAWGFEYKTYGFDWLKLNPSGEGLLMGRGNWTRGNGEICKLFTRGAPMRLAADVLMAVLTPVGKNSAKPEEIHERIERLVGGPYLELYARQEHPGWTTWGNEIARASFEADLACAAPADPEGARGEDSSGLSSDRADLRPEAAHVAYAGDRSRKWNGDIGTKVVELHEGPRQLTLRQVADELGVDRGQVKGIYRRFNEKRSRESKVKEAAE